jgi:predicted ribosome quality control (RQC) complex YloA/Tae2 family protein
MTSLRQKVFSSFARSAVNTNPKQYPDAILQSWMNQEERLFKTLKKHYLGIQITTLQTRKKADPEKHMQLLMSFQQRIKSRSGSLFENHLERIFNEHSITFYLTNTIDGKRKPDFIFPSIATYHKLNSGHKSLTMLAEKPLAKIDGDKF